MNELSISAIPDLVIPGTTADDSVTIRPIANNEELIAVQRLTHDCYVANGYAAPHADGRLAHYMDFDGLPETTVIVAVRHGEVIGSDSVTLDGSWGLTVDQDFRKACESLRYSGRNLAVMWRFVMSESERTSSRRIVMGILRQVITVAMLNGANTGITTVNPRHAPFYKRLLNMKEVGFQDGTKGLNKAPGILLRLDFDSQSLPDSWKYLDNYTTLKLAA